MGQTASKPYNNPQMQQLKQLYSPISKLSELPGQPLYIQYVSPLQNKNNSYAYCPQQAFLELYSVQLNKSQKDVIQDAKIYDQRKHNFPWVVKVICYDVQKKLCECSTFSYKYTVCTQRVQFRLNSFKIIDKDSTNVTSSYKYLQSLSFQQAVYLLINIFQGLEILNQQYKINFPTSKSIGIAKSGQIKVWINDNWAMNDQSLFLIPQKAIIQESLKLVAQRTKGNLFKMLRIEHSYQNLKFHQIQAILSQFVIAYNHGKKSLIQRLNDINSRLSTDPIKIRKYSLKKEKRFELQQGYTLHTPSKIKNQKYSTQRRFYSNDSKHEKSRSAVVVNQNYFNTQVNSNRNANSLKLKKQITFIYTQPQDSNIQISQKQKFPTQMSFPQGASSIRLPVKSSPLFDPFSKMEYKNNSFPHFQKAIERKISENTKTITITTVNSNEQIKKEQYIHDKKCSLPVRNSNTGNKSILQISKYQNLNKGIFQNTNKAPIKQKQSFSAIDYSKLLKEDKKNPKIVRFVAPESILAQEQVKVIQMKTEEVTPQKIESIISITEQFRQLLQSDKKIQSQSDYQDEQLFQISLMSLQKSEKKLPQVQDDILFYQKSESDIEMERPFQRKCYSIKEVDEDLSYEMQSNYNK